MENVQIKTTVELLDELPEDMKDGEVLIDNTDFSDNIVEEEFHVLENELEQVNQQLLVLHGQYFQLFNSLPLRITRKLKKNPFLYKISTLFIFKQLTIHNTNHTACMFCYT